MRLRWLIWAIPVLLLGTCLWALAEEVILTTYYPSPRGVYKDMKVVKELTVGSFRTPKRAPAGTTFSVAGAPATMLGGPNDNCPAGYDWYDEDLQNPGGANLAEECKPTGLVVTPQAGNVGIGTPNPGAKLDVAGTLRTTDLSCPGCIDAADVTFAYAGSSTKGGPATDLSCTSCVALGSETAGAYAASTSAGGPATSLSLSALPGQCPGGQYSKGIDQAGNARGCTSVSGEVVAGITTINSMTGPAITLAQGSGVTITNASNTVTISATSTAQDLGAVTGSGLTNYVARWRTGSELTYDSAGLYQTDAGRVGIGTTNPGTNKLQVVGNVEVNGQIKVTGGGPGANKVLTSDASGLASWGELGVGGISLYTVRFGPSHLNCTAQCNAGDEVTGGGCDAGAATGGIAVSRPTEVGNGWECTIQRYMPVPAVNPVLCHARCLHVE